jgi:hypothetical protein
VLLCRTLAISRKFFRFYRVILKVRHNGTIGTRLVIR